MTICSQQSCKLHVKGNVQGLNFINLIPVVIHDFFSNKCPTIILFVDADISPCCVGQLTCMTPLSAHTSAELRSGLLLNQIS